MIKKDFEKLPIPQGVTYIPGLGFISPNNSLNTIKDIRKNSTIICFGLILFWLLKKIIYKPCVYIAYYFGFDVIINKYTGLVMADEFTYRAIDSISYSVSLIITIIFIIAACLKRFDTVFRFPQKHSIGLSVPIIIAVGFLGVFCGKIFYNTTEFLGFVFPHIDTPIIYTGITENIHFVTSSLLIILLEEILFRGVILFFLRQYGDGFAVMISAVLFTIYQNNVSEMIPAFIFSFTLGYFVLRSGSFFTSIIGRFSFFAIIYGLALSSKFLETSLANLIIVLTQIISLTFAMYSFFSFIRTDKNAFVIKKSRLSISFRRRLMAFCSTLTFVIYILFVLINTTRSVQIIG